MIESVVKKKKKKINNIIKWIDNYVCALSDTMYLDNVNQFYSKDNPRMNIGFYLVWSDFVIIRENA